MAESEETDAVKRKEVQSCVYVYLHRLFPSANLIVQDCLLSSTAAAQVVSASRNRVIVVLFVLNAVLDFTLGLLFCNDAVELRRPC